MTDKPTAAEAATVADIPSRTNYATPEAALAALQAASESMADFASVKLLTAGVDAEGGLDPAVYTDDTETVVSAIQLKAAGQPMRTVALVVYPAPTLEALMADVAGTDWVRKIIRKELNHVAVRGLRPAAGVEPVYIDSDADKLPTTISGFITASRGDGGSALESFNAVYKVINVALSTRYNIWQRAGLVKAELRKAMESRGYAMAYYPALEDRKVSLFVAACHAGLGLCATRGLDAAIFQRWLDNRDAAVFDASSVQLDDEDEDIDFAELVAIGNAPAKPAA